MKQFASLMTLLFLCLLAVGCGQSFDASYGPSTGVAGHSSVNGFGALRSSYENAGYKTRDIRRLTQRVRRSNVIVWTPQVLKPIDIKVTRWFERWLRHGGRTLVYVVPDSGSEADYWVQAGMSAPPGQRMEYRRRAARKLNERLQWTVNRRDTYSNGWFAVKPKSQIFRRGDLSTKNWDLASQSSATPQAGEPDAQRSILTEYVIEPYDAEDKKNQPPATAPITFSNQGPTGPATPYTSFASEEKTRTKVHFRSLIDTESGDSIVSEITSDGWHDSKIIVVAGGSLLTNFAFTQPANAELAEELIAQSASGQSGDRSTDDPATNETDDIQTAGFLLSSYNPIPVSESKPGVPQASGMELLTVWPMSLVTIHAALLGFVVCMMLLPIFGRARNVERGSTSNFGDHLDAVASLMNNARGEKYARARINEYMRRMKGETTGDWVIPDAPKAPQPVTPASTPLDAEAAGPEIPGRKIPGGQLPAPDITPNLDHTAPEKTESPPAGKTPDRSSDQFRF
ncbi:hypothetical protein [Planctomycetes bacterium K23_9]|uniref:DUF4350 domain-containing protein n=1 Tax=Stieleria marina TaxID=1930275 RepID=A0A517NSW1_9BACT|nr:hypothetical protein K239x_21730 [Planctomycetes bacterium K23_9]